MNDKAVYRTAPATPGLLNEDHDHLKEKIELLEKGVQKDNDNLKQKIEVLEKVTHALTRKVFSLEKELEDSKMKENTFLEITSGIKEKRY